MQATSADAPPAGHGRAPLDGPIRRLAAVMLTLLGIQLLLGMTVNLFVSIPASHPGTGAGGYLTRSMESVGWALGQGPTMLQLHVGLGLLLIAGGVVLLWWAASLRRHTWLWAATVGLTGLIGAAFNGMSFLDFNQDFSSLIMTVGFVIASGAYVAGLYIAG